MFNTDQTNQLIVLFILDKMEVPLKEQVIVNIITDNNWMSYMECKECISSLIKNNLLVNLTPKASEPRYNIPAESKEGFSHFYTNIPFSLREEILNTLKTQRINYRKKQDYFSDYYQNADGTWTVVLKIESSTVPLMELRLAIQSSTKAKWIHQNWPDKAALVYEYIHENLID